MLCLRRNDVQDFGVEEREKREGRKMTGEAMKVNEAACK